MAPYVQTKYTTSRIRVALVIEGGKIKPVWFEDTSQPTSDRVFIKSINYSWTSLEGSAKVLNFAVTSKDDTGYELSLNTREFTWRLGVVEQRDYC